MAVTEYEQNRRIGKLPTAERTPEQKVFIALMSRLDLLKFSPDLRVDGGIERWSKNVRPNSLKGLSDVSAELLHSKKLTLFVEYHEEERRVGLRNTDKEIVFILNKEDENYLIQVGERVGNGHTDGWMRGETSEIPIEDAFVITDKEVLGFKL